MSFFKKETVTYDYRFSGQLVESIGVNIPTKVFFTITLAGDIITIVNSTMSFTLNKSQVSHAAMYGERERIVTNKSAIGRGVVGGLLFGNTGAVVGGMSGAGGKQTEKQHFFTFIAFKSSSGVDCRLNFEVFPPVGSVDKFNSAITPKQKAAVQL